MTKFYSLTIANIRPETDSAICLSLNIPDELKQKFTFTPGQFLTLQASIDGEVIRRCYSICSGVDEAQLSIAIKRVDKGVFSNFANDNFNVGDSIEVMPPQGDFTLNLNDDASSKQLGKNYMLLAAGSGITPILSLIKSIFSRELNSKITLVYGNQKNPYYDVQRRTELY